MNVAVPLYGVLLVLGGCALLWLMWRWVKAIENSAGRIEQADKQLCAALAASSSAMADLREQWVVVAANADDLQSALVALTGKLAPAAADLQTHLAAIPKLLEMVAKVGQLQLEAIRQQRAEAEERARNPFGRATGPLPPRDTAAANLEDQVQELMRAEGIGREEALLRLNPANARSVWEGNKFFEGWR